MGRTETLITLLLLVATAFAVASMQAAWLRRRTPGARSFSWMMLSAAIWTFGAALEYSSDTYALKIFWSKFQYLGIATLPTFWLIFCLNYSQAFSNYLPRIRSKLIWFGLIPAIAIVLVATNEMHGLIWRDVVVTSTSSPLLVEYIHGVGFWIIVAYNYVLLALGTLSLGWSIARFPALYRRQSAWLIGGAMIPWVVNFLYLAGYRLASGVDLTPVAFVAAGIIYTFQIFRLHLLDLVPVVQDTVVESMSEGVAVVDDDGRIVYINPSGRMLLNLPVRLSAPVGFALPHWDEIVTLVEKSRLNSDLPVTTEIQIGDVSPRRIEVQVTPLLRSPARPSGQLILLRDITQQHQSEEQLRLQSVALEAAPNAIVITDASGRILWVNPAFTHLTGYTIEEVQGKNPRILKSGKHSESFYRDLWQTILSGRTWQGELINRNKDGDFYIEDATIAPVRNSHGDVTHFIAIKQNVTERKELEKMRDDLMQAIVHDLRNPLNSILFSLDMVQRLPPIDQVPIDILSTIEISRENAWRMLGMINSILDLSRLENNNMPLMLEKVVLAELVEQTIHAQAMIAQRREVLILNDVPYDLPDITVDRLLISRVFQNLLDNAIKFANQGSNIEVSAYLEAEISSVVVSVHDEGPAISPDLQSVLFQKFITGPSPRRGSGLGLAFCRLAVEAHAGNIWVESQDGHGVTFLFRLPIQPQGGSEIRPKLDTSESLHSRR